MQHFYTVHLNKGKRITLLIILAFFTATLLLIEHFSTYTTFSNSQETALTKGNIKENRISLTFNISWGDEKVHDILQTLKSNDVRATFFVSGEWAEKHPQILEKIVSEKHEIGMLGYRYKSYLQLDIEQVRKDILYAQEVFKKLGFKDLKYVRPPSGHFNKEIISLIERLGFEVVHWSVNPNDWENPGVDRIVTHVNDETSNGDIILLHASDSAKQTSQALNILIPILRERNLQLATLSELINNIQMNEKLINKQ